MRRLLENAPADFNRNRPAAAKSTLAAGAEGRQFGLTEGKNEGFNPVVLVDQLFGQFQRGIALRIGPHLSCLAALSSVILVLALALPAFAASAPADTNAVAAPAAVAVPDAAKPKPRPRTCHRFAHSTNDYGKIGPTSEAKRLVEVAAENWAAAHKVKRFSLGAKSVKCVLFLDFGLFDEYTCTAEMSICY